MKSFFLDFLQFVNDAPWYKSSKLWKYYFFLPDILPCFSEYNLKCFHSSYPCHFINKTQSLENITQALNIWSNNKVFCSAKNVSTKINNYAKFKLGLSNQQFNRALFKKHFVKADKNVLELFQFNNLREELWSNWVSCFSIFIK